MNIEKVIPEFKKIVTALDVPEEKMLEKFNSWSKYLKNKLTTANLQQIIPDQSFYDNALMVDNDLTKNILAVSIQYVEQASQQNWDEALKDNSSYLFNLLGILLKLNKITDLPDNAFSAYKESLKTIGNDPNGYDISSDSKQLWKLLYEKSDKIHLQPTIKDIRDTFIRDIDISEEQFLFFEPLLREQGGLIEKSGDVVRKILVPLLSDNDCLNVLLITQEFYASIIISAGNDAFDFIDTLREKIESNQGGTEIVEFERKINSKLAGNIRILYAKYYSPLKDETEAIEITDKLRKTVEVEKQLHFKVDNGIVDGRDPDEGHIKNLYVKYSYNGEEKDKIFDEHKWLKLP